MSKYLTQNGKTLYNVCNPKLQKHSTLSNPADSDNVIGIGTLDVIPGLGDVVAISVGVILVNVTAEDGLIGLPVTLIAAGLRAVETTINSHAILHSKGGRGTTR